MAELTDNERAVLAREVAADGFDYGEDFIEAQCDECNYVVEVEAVPSGKVREAFAAGWDAAIAYVQTKVQ